MDANLVIKLKIKTLTQYQQQQLNQLMIQYRDACQYISEYVFNHDFEINSNTLSKVLYYDVKERFGLKAQLVSSSFKTVTARYKTVQTQLKQRPYHYKDDDGTWHNIKRDLNWLHQPINFKRPQADLQRVRDYSFVNDGQQLSLQTLQKGRIKADFTTKGFQHYLDNGWQMKTAKLVKSGSHFFLHVAVAKEVTDFDKQSVKHVVGIDRGLNFLSTTYDEKNHTSFVNGRSIINKRTHFKHLRAILQSKHTASARRRLKAIGQRENRWISDVNHRITKTLVDRYGKDTLFVMEDLTNITFNVDKFSKAQRSNFKSWAFYQFEQFLTYKAHLQQSSVVKVSAKYTSQRCPKCGSIRKENRNHHFHEYRCDNCGYISNDDRIGAMNIQQLGTQYISGNDKPHFSLLDSNNE